MGEIITAVMTGCITLLGVLLSNRAAQAVTDEKLAELTREVRELNDFARRTPGAGGASAGRGPQA